MFNELTSTPAATFSYDGNGNTATKVDASGTTTYTWDSENRLTSVALPGGAGTVTFKYDPFGRRIQKSSATGTTNYLYDGSNSVEELDATGAALAHYAQGAGIDEPLSALRGGATGFYEQDGLGSVTSLSNATGTVLNSYTYDSFGNTTTSSGSFVNPYLFTGRDLDPETGLRYYRARYYDPNSGRFLSEDPLEFGAGMNFYRYAESNPINFVDPSGGNAAPVPIPSGPGPVLVPNPPPSANPSPWTVLRWCAWNPVVCATVIVLATPTDLNPSEQQWIDEKKKKKPGCPNPSDPCDPSNFDYYFETAGEPYKGGPISNAGSGLQSHAGRGQGFPVVTGPPSAWNDAAQTLVEEILTNPLSKCTIGKSKKQGDWVQVRLPNGMGARWTLDGRWIGFIGP